MRRYNRSRSAGNVAVVISVLAAVHWVYWQCLSDIRYEFYSDVIRVQFGTLFGMLILCSLLMVFSWAVGVGAWRASLRLANLEVHTQREQLVWVGVLVAFGFWILGLDAIASVVTGRGVW